MTLQAFLYNVLSHPNAYKKLVEEVLSRPLDDIVSSDDAQSLTYFQACLKEAIRFQPAAFFNIVRYTPEEGAELDGALIPGHTIVSFHPWVVHRDKEIFGPDADRFRPERWLEADPEQIRMMERCNFGVSNDLLALCFTCFNPFKCIPGVPCQGISACYCPTRLLTLLQFGGGSHVCIGKNFALLQVNMILPSLVRRYEMKLLPGNKRAPGQSSGFAYLEDGLHVHVHLKRRQIDDVKQ